MIITIQMKDTWTKEEQAENRRAWVSNLRSRKFKQGRGVLYDRRTDCHCVLGVACATFGDTFNGTPPPCKNDNDKDFFSGCVFSDFGHLYGMLPKKVADALGLKCDAGTDFEEASPGTIGGEALWRLNDGVQQIYQNPEPKPYTFEELADYIEQHESEFNEDDSNV